MHNEYIEGGGYTKPCARPNAKSFIAKLRDMGAHLAIWCGAFTAKRLNELLDFVLPEVGLKKKDFVFIFPALPECTTTKSYAHKKNKKIVLKPVCLVRQVLMNAYKHIILFDNNIEKSLGFSQKPGSRWSNGPGEHIEVTPFHTKNVDTDNELHITEGEGARKLFDCIRQHQVEIESEVSHSVRL